MRYVTSNDVDPAEDYLLIGYRNRFGQFDVAKLKLTLLSSYYISNSKVDELSQMLDNLSSFLSSVLDNLSSETIHDKITVMELSAYCSRARLNDLLDERTFIECKTFMDYLKENFTTKKDVDEITKLETASKPIGIAVDKIDEMYNGMGEGDGAFAPKPKEEKKD